mgnify:CR=1 FL=1
MMKTTIAAALALVVASGAAMAEFKDFTVNGDLVTKGQQEPLQRKPSRIIPILMPPLRILRLRIRCARWSSSTR